MQKLSSNVAHGQNVAVLTAVAELGTEAVLRSLGNDSTATTLEGEFLTREDIKSAIVARTVKYLGQ